MKNTKEISSEDLLNFLSRWFITNKIELSVDKAIDLTSLIIACFNNSMMFDSWFRGIDVMN